MPALPDLSIGELVAVGIAVLLALSATRFGRDLVRGLLLGVHEFHKAEMEILFPKAATSPKLQPKFDPVVWLAQGLGIGRLRPGPGTWGSLFGILWFALLVATGSIWGYCIGTIHGVFLSVVICGLAEKKLGEKDPGSVVLDEVIAMPLCFGAWVLSHVHATGQMPEVRYFLSGNNWLGVIGIFAAFRLFDIWKPWPVRQSQSLPGGWGVTVDDLLAALYVNLLSLPFLIG